MYFAILFALFHVKKHVSRLLRAGEIRLGIAVHLRAVAADEAQALYGVVLLVAALHAREHAVPRCGDVAVYVAARRAEIARPRDRGGDDELLYMPLQVAAGDGLIALNAFAGNAVLYLEIVRLRDVLERVAGIELAELDKGAALSGGVGQGVCEHGAGDILVRVDGV